MNATDLFMHSKKLEGFNLLKFIQYDMDKSKIKEFYELIRSDFDDKNGELFGVQQ